MLDFPPDYKQYPKSLPPNSTLDELMEFLYQYHYIKIHAQGNSHVRLEDKEQEIYFKFLGEHTINIFEMLLTLHMEGAISLRLRLPKKSEGYVRDGFINLLKPFNERIGFFGKMINTEELSNHFDEIKQEIHEQDTLYTDILIRGYRFTMLFFRAIGSTKGIEYSGSIEEHRLLERIGNMINHNPDYQNEIILYYEIENYITKNYLDYPIIYHLAEERLLEVKDIVFQNKEIQIILHRFNNFPMSIQKEDDSGLVFDEDSGKVSLNGKALVQLKIGKNDYKFFHTLYLSLGKSVTYEELKNHIKKGRISSTNEQYCHKIKNKLPEAIKYLIMSSGEGYILDPEAKK